ncbi:MAG: SH3 domain-containing protein [Betaproteobacteria bacterium]|nr:MAG: SH3 domain-containing protein [Betaproteobacteria bacterium]
MTDRLIDLAPALFMAAVLALGTVAFARAEPISVQRDSALRVEPSLGASTAGTVRRGARGESLGRSGIWVNIRTDEGTGWVFTFNIRFGERVSGGGDLTAAGRMVSARPSTSVVSTIGIRGLSEEDLQKATFNAAEMRRLDGFTVTADDSTRRAQERGLAGVSLDYLEAP